VEHIRMRSRVSDPHLFHTDPDPGFKIFADPDPGCEIFATSGSKA